MDSFKKICFLILITNSVLIFNGCIGNNEEDAAIEFTCLYDNYSELNIFWTKIESVQSLKEYLRPCRSEAFTHQFVKSIKSSFGNSDDTLLKISKPPSPAPLPSSYTKPPVDKDVGSSIFITLIEADQLEAVRLAHLVWVHFSQLLPWNLEYWENGVAWNPRDLESLFSPIDFTYETNGTVKVDYMFFHDPSWSWNHIMTRMKNLKITPESIVTAIADSTRHFRHGAQYAPYNDKYKVVTLQEMNDSSNISFDGRPISLRGCQSASPYLAHLARVFLIPAYTVRGHYGFGGHRSAVFPIANYVLSHGDDIYSTLYDQLPSQLMLSKLDYWEQKVFVEPKDSKSSAYYSALAPRQASALEKYWDPKDFESTCYQSDDEIIKSIRKIYDPFPDDFPPYVSQEKINYMIQSVINYCNSKNINPSSNKQMKLLWHEEIFGI